MRKVDVKFGIGLCEVWEQTRYSVEADIRVQYEKDMCVKQKHKVIPTPVLGVSRHPYMG